MLRRRGNQENRYSRVPNGRKRARRRQNGHPDLHERRSGSCSKGMRKPGGMDAGSTSMEEPESGSWILRGENPDTGRVAVRTERCPVMRVAVPENRRNRKASGCGVKDMEDGSSGNRFQTVIRCFGMEGTGAGVCKSAFSGSGRTDARGTGISGSRNGAGARYGKPGIRERRERRGEGDGGGARRRHEPCAPENRCSFQQAIWPVPVRQGKKSAAAGR